MGIEVELGDCIAFRAREVSEFEALAVVTKVLEGGWFVCYSTTQPYRDLGEFALRDSDRCCLEIEVLQKGEEAVRNQSDNELELNQRVGVLVDDELKFVEGRVVAVFGGKVIVEDDEGRRHHGDVELCVPSEID